MNSRQPKMKNRALLHNGLSDTTIHEYTTPPPPAFTIDRTPTPSIHTSDRRSLFDLTLSPSPHLPLICQPILKLLVSPESEGRGGWTTQKIMQEIPQCHLHPHESRVCRHMCHHHLQVLYVCASSNEAIAKLKDVGTRIANEIKRDIGQQWKSLSNEDRQKYKYLAKLAKEDLAKQKALLPPKPKKRKLQNRISLKSIVGIVQKLSKDQRLAVELIGLGGLLHLRCTVLNHPLCNWLVKNFDPKSCSLNVHGRTFLLTVAHVHECLRINAEGKVIDLEVNMSDEFSQLCENIGMTKGVVQLKELIEYLDETEEVFYFDRMSPSPKVMSYVRKFPTLVNWGDIEIKNILHEFDKIGGYDSEGVVVNFTLDEGTKVDENTSGNEASVSQILAGDVSVMTNTLITIASLLLRQNMILGKHFGSEMLSDLEAQTTQEMDLKHGHEGPSSHLLTQLTGLHTCQTSSVKEFEAHDPMVNQAKGVEANPTQARHLASEMLSKPQQQEQPPPQMAQQMDRNQSVILQVESSPLFTGVHTCETSTPNKLKTPDYALNKSKAVYDMPTSCFDQYNTGIEMDMDEDEDVVSPSPVSGLKSLAGSSRGTDTRKRKIQQDVDEVVSSPSPLSAFKSQAGLSRGRKKQLAFGKPVMSFCDEPRQLRERAKLKKSQFQRSPFTKDGLKKRNPPKNKNQPKTQSNNIADQHQIVENIDINVPTFRGVYGKMKSLKFAGAMQELNPQSKRQILSNPNLNDSDLMKLCDSYFRDANFTADLSSCSMIYIRTNDRGNHWFCIKVDLGIQMAYIFYSKPATRSNLFRKRLTKKVMEVLHRALRLQYGDLYKIDVNKFNIANVERQPLQHETDGYDCGLFVIKFMQGFNYPSGVHRMDDSERPRLLMGLLVDPNNRERDTVVKKFDDWKAKKGQTGFVYAGGHLVRLDSNNL
ncbi:hypothetical protein RHMOL_Rhmol04G0264700 [Rhododendron molle]|uniref:Uncharacterized protein n=1 Tax=Rhododendron molle TaxID=49168 RepID=A0ACC0P4F4_RHOML|nr:hypothetical protein RHMOL_Rhmol04G0264700 [Rhododendron molle]